MISIFQNISIKQRFNILLATVIIAFSALMIFFGITLNNVKKYHDYNKSIDNLTVNYLNIRRYEQYFLSRYAEDPGFFTTHQNKYLKKHEIATKKFEAVVEDLRQNKLTKDLKLNENLNRITSFGVNYNQIFANLFDKIIKKGSPTSGIIGNLNYSSKEAFESSKTLYYNNYILTLIQYSDNYLYSKDSKHYKHFIESFINLSNEINKTEIIVDTTGIEIDSTVNIINSGVSKAFIKNVNDFKQNFTALINIDKEIGITYEDGLNKDLRAEIKKFDPEIEQLSNKILADKNKALGNIYNSIYIFAVFVAIFLIFLILQFSTSITKPIEELTFYITPLSKGNLPDNLGVSKGENEISQITSSVNELITGLKKTTDFAITIGKGIFDTHYIPLGNEDKLGNSLIEMRQNLNQAKIEEEKRKKEDDMRKWANEGLANFNDILRKSTGDIKKLSDIVIKELVHFLKANQAGLFIYNNADSNDSFYELTASYAFGHEKKKQKKIYPGEGLVGTAAVEKETVYMTDIPKQYITITSGLGGATPRSLLIVPMRVENEVFGVIEIASFNQFQTHEIEFIEKVSENIASSLSITRINSKTAFLLEQSQLQAEQMATQEQEMRQNFEELQMSQEESARREAEMTSILSAIDNSSLVIEIDTKGYITSANRGSLELFSIPEPEIVGQLHQEFISPEDETEYLRFWSKVKEGQHVSRAEHIVIGGNEFWLQVIYAAILDDSGNVIKILSLATDFTESKKIEIELKVQADAMLSQEEMMRKNLEELHNTQQEMATKQLELEEINLKAKSNEKALRRTIDKSKEQEKELESTIKELDTTKDQLLEQQYTGVEYSEDVKKDFSGKIKLDLFEQNNLIAKYTINGIFIEANQIFYDTYAYSINDLSGKHHRIFTEVEYRKSKEYIEFLNLIKQGERIDGEYTRIHSSGKTLYFKGSYIPLKNSNGEYTEFLEVFDNVSNYKSLKNDFNEINSFLNNVNCVVNFNTKGKITKTNDLFAKVMNIDKADIEGKNFKDFVNQEYAESIEYMHLWRDANRGKVVSGLFKALNKDKAVVIFDGAFTGLKDSSGNISQIIFIGKEVIQE